MGGGLFLATENAKGTGMTAIIFASFAVKGTLKN
jgi:hypothetical protein